uniref:Uncharacterized protein n=1 Tax=Hucho hucho TaxID=62062 RepID=A0A4W5RRB3_9TELE
MMLHCVQLRQLAVCIIGSWGWLSNKCVLYDTSVRTWDIFNPMDCRYNSLSAICWDVQYVTSNSTYPSSRLTTRPSVSRSGMQFSFRFNVKGCLPPILPGTFKGLSSVKALSLFCELQCYNSSLPSNTFSDLANMEELSIQNYGLSVMVMGAMGDSCLKKITVNSCTQELSDLLCRIVDMPWSLTTLNFETKEIILRHQNCSGTNGAILELSYFYHL